MFNKKEIESLENECYNLRNEINYLKKSIRDICPHESIVIELGKDLKTTYDTKTHSYNHEFGSSCVNVKCNVCGFKETYFKGSKPYSDYLKIYTKLKKKQLEELK